MGPVVGSYNGTQGGGIVWGNPEQGDPSKIGGMTREKSDSSCEMRQMTVMVTAVGTPSSRRMLDSEGINVEI